MAEKDKPPIFRAIIQMLFVVVIAPFLPMILSGDWSWWQGWAYAVTSILAFLVSRLIVMRVHPDLIQERVRFLQARDTKTWDKVLAPLLGMGSVLMLVVAGLDRSFGWSSSYGATGNWIALAGIVFGYAFSSWALVVNRFFAGTVRIQTERGQHVITHGPYRIIRHPGYAGGLFGYIFIPLLLDSAWAFVPAALLGLVMVTRTALEDATLQKELPGYAEYACRTRYRLLPGIW